MPLICGKEKILIFRQMSACLSRSVFFFQYANIRLQLSRAQTTGDSAERVRSQAWSFHWPEKRKTRIKDFFASFTIQRWGFFFSEKQKWMRNIFNSPNDILFHICKCTHGIYWSLDPQMKCKSKALRKILPQLLTPTGLAKKEKRAWKPPYCGSERNWWEPKTW